MDDWKLLITGDGRKFLFDLSSPDHERRNLISQHPDRAAALEAKLSGWASELSPAGLPTTFSTWEKRVFEIYLGDL